MDGGFTTSHVFLDTVFYLGPVCSLRSCPWRATLAHPASVRDNVVKNHHTRQRSRRVGVERSMRALYVGHYSENCPCSGQPSISGPAWDMSNSQPQCILAHSGATKQSRGTSGESSPKALGRDRFYNARAAFAAIVLQPPGLHRYQ